MRGAFVFRYRPDRTIHAPTEIFVGPLHYPHGYAVRVDGAGLSTAPPVGWRSGRPATG